MPKANVSQSGKWFTFRSGERTFRSGVCTFRSGERTFRTAEYNSNPRFIQIHFPFPNTFPSSKMINSPQ